jgi:autotransporter-associated beta strand protein
VDGAPVSIQAAPLPGGNTTVATWDSTNRHLLVRIASRVVTATATVVVTPANTPAAPSGLSAAAVSSAQINLAWTDNATNETGFKILRRTGVSGSYTQIATVGANVTTFTNTGLTAATAYYYRVCATNAAGESALGNEAGAVTFEVPPTAPSALTTTTMATNRIDLSWTDNANNETGFIIARKTGAGGIYTQIATVGSNVTSFIDTNGLLANTVYYYRVAATNISGLSPFSAEALGTTVLPPPPAVPTNLRAVAVSGSQIGLTWTDSATNEAGFKLQRKIGAGGTYAQVATFAANTTNYLDFGLEASTAYFYRLSATNAGGDSAFSNQTNATTFAVGTVTMDGNDGFGSTSFNTALNWNNNQVPSGSNQYLTANYLLRTPAGAGGNLTFAGHSLSIDNSGSLLLKGAGGSSITVNKLRLNRGTIRNGEGGTTLTVLGDVTVQADSTLDADSGGRTIVIAAPIVGSAHLTVASAVSSGGIVRVTGTNDAFTGNWTNSAASTLQVGDGGIGGSLGRGRVINNGVLVFNRSDAFSSTNLISGSGPVNVIGSGTVTLAGTNTYTGATTVNGGTLLVNGALGNSTVFVNFSATLGGTGSISGAVSVSGGFAPGANGIGRLTISNALTLGGGATFELNRSLSPSNDLVVVTGDLNGGGTLAVNNLGGALVAGDSFALFNKAVSGAFSSINFPALPVGLGWTNRLAVDGTIAVVATALPSTPATNPNPVAGALNVTLNPTLTWSPGVNATNHRVYFGYSSNAVAGATTNSAEFKGAFANASFTPSPLASSGRFYWRVDEVGPTVVGGATWTFATLVNPAAGFVLTGSLGNDFGLSYPSQLGQTYRLERSDGLNPANWQTLSNNIPGTGGPILINDSGSNTQRFYRAVILPP